MKHATLRATVRRSLAVVAALGCCVATAAELHVFAPNAVKEPLEIIVARFEKSSGHRVVLRWAGIEAITKRVGDGETADVVVNAAQNIEKLTADGKLVDGSRTDFARSAIGVAIPESLPRPDIASVDGLKQALLAAKSVAISSGTSGRYLLKMFDRLAIRQQIEAKLVQPPSGAQIGEIIARGEAELGFQQVSELVHVPGIRYLGPLPPEIQNYTVYSAAIHRQALQPGVAKSFLGALREAEAATAIGQSGMEPVR